MKLPSHGWRYAALGLVLVAFPIAAACSVPDDSGKSEANQTDGEDGLEILFPKMYSAFDGVHEFRVPAKVEGVKKPTWSIEPKDGAELDPQKDGTVLITIKKAGTFKVTVKSPSGDKGTAPLTVTEATEEDWEEGRARYNNDTPVFVRPDGGWSGRGDGGGGRGDRDGGRREWTPNPEAACTNCHNGGKGNDVEHTPMQTAGYSDEEMAKIFTEGQKPEGVKMRVKTTEWYAKNHKWKMDPEAVKGIIVYLRSLEPESQGEVDLDFGRGRGKGDGRRDGGSGGSRRDSGSSGETK